MCTESAAWGVGTSILWEVYKVFGLAMNMTWSMPRGRFLVKDQVPASSPCSPWASPVARWSAPARAGMRGSTSVMLVRSATPVGLPPTVKFIAPEEWTQVEMRLEELATAILEIIARPVGGFGLEVDEVEVRGTVERRILRVWWMRSWRTLPAWGSGQRLLVKHRPHAYQGSSRWRESRQGIV